MTSYAPPQHPSAPPMYPQEAIFTPKPPPREDLDRIQQDPLISKPRPPVRRDRPDAAIRTDHSHRRASGQNIRKDENEENPAEPIGDCLYNYNNYATKKTIGHGMLVFALIASNALQLRTLILQKQRDNIWTISLVLVCLSLLFQIGLACLLIIVGKGDIQNPAKQSRLGFFNCLSLILIFIIMMMNVFINAFMLSTNPSNFVQLSSAELPLTNT